MKKNKYRNREKVVDGIVFQSIAESRRYQELKLLQKAGEIAGLKLQPEFTLLPGFTDYEGKKQRPITYRADFSYLEKGKNVVEDCKSPATRTSTYMIKKKMLLYSYQELVFREV